MDCIPVAVKLTFVALIRKPEVSWDMMPILSFGQPFITVGAFNIRPTKGSFRF